MTEEEIMKWIERYNQEFLDFIMSLTPEEKMIAFSLFNQQLSENLGKLGMKE